eukprot:TRINITY_DN558_c0_g1_i3.p2 TRINITY_DN558_c0_g1~~TRINITY_DN558_c0_g1_i3.p2  ORF type:complete len:295 (-),score=58.15 TRINITY_DN558_c0_g1_i3:2085-2969(-)
MAFALANDHTALLSCEASPSPTPSPPSSPAPQSPDSCPELEAAPEAPAPLRRRLRAIYAPRGLLRTKSVEQVLAEEMVETDRTRLRRSLGLAQVIAYGVGVTVGAGIYSLVGVGAAKAGCLPLGSRVWPLTPARSFSAGPAIVLSFVLGSVACVFTGLTYSEFAARFPIAGSAYTFSYASFGELVAWIIGWDITLEYAISSAAISRSFGDYFMSLFSTFGVDLPLWLNAIPFANTQCSVRCPSSPSPCCPAPQLPTTTQILAAMLCVLCTLVLMTGVQQSSWINLVTTAMNLEV